MEDLESGASSNVFEPGSWETEDDKETGEEMQLKPVSSSDHEDITVVAPARETVDMGDDEEEEKENKPQAPALPPPRQARSTESGTMTLERASADDDEEQTVLRAPRADDRPRVPTLPPPVRELSGLSKLPVGVAASRISPLPSSPEGKTDATPTVQYDPSGGVSTRKHPSGRATPPPPSAGPRKAPSVPPPPAELLRSAVRSASQAPPAVRRTGPPSQKKPMPEVPPAPVMFAAAHVPPPPRSRDTIPPAAADPRPRSSSISPFANSVMPPGRGAGKGQLLLVALALAAVVLAGYTALRPTSGALVVTSEGGDDAVAVFVDGQKRCDRTPCRVDELAEGSHLVRTESGDQTATAERAVVVSAGATNTHHVTLGKAADAAAALRVIAEGPGLRVTVDGRDLGAPPLSLDDLDPGTHAVRISGGDGYEAYEETIHLSKGETRSLGPIQLKPVQRAHEPRETTRARSSNSAGRKEARPSTRSARRAPAARSSSGGGEKGILSINSVPRSKVIVDGHPLGDTPIAGVRVKPGSHTVVFIHPEKGRKIVNTVVQGGGRATAMVRF